MQPRRPSASAADVVGAEHVDVPLNVLAQASALLALVPEQAAAMAYHLIGFFSAFARLAATMRATVGVSSGSQRDLAAAA